MMYSVFIRNFVFIFLTFFLTSTSATAKELGVINVVSSGKSVAEAITTALKANANKSLIGDRQLIQNILEREILPRTNQFATTYKVLEGSDRAGFVNISVSVDLNAMQELINFSPKLLGLENGKAPVTFVLRTAEVDGDVELMVKEVFTRRKFSWERASATIESSIPVGDAAFSVDLLKNTFSDSQSALIALLTITRELVENENTHKDETRIFLQAALFDLKKGQFLVKQKLYTLDMGAVKEMSQSLFLNLFSQYVEQNSNSSTTKDVIPLIVLDPPSYKIINNFRVAVEGLKDVKKIIEKQVQRGAYEFAVYTTITSQLLQQKITGLNLEGVEILPESANLDKGAQEAVRIQLKEKQLPVSVTPVTAPEAGANGKKN